MDVWTEADIFLDIVGAEVDNGFVCFVLRAKYLSKYS